MHLVSPWCLYHHYTHTRLIMSVLLKLTELTLAIIGDYLSPPITYMAPPRTVKAIW